MKHNSEDISRLDGDIYETASGRFIDMSKILMVSEVAFERYMCWHFHVTMQLHEKPLFLEVYAHLGEDYRGQAEEKRQQFINIWKEWKKNEARK